MSLIGRACVFSFARIYEDSMVASQRVALLVSRTLGLPLITDLNIKKDVPRRLDALLIVNGAYGFCRCLPELGELVERARRVVWVQQDYIIIPPKAESGAESPFRLAFRRRAEDGKPHIDYWTTVGPNARSTSLSSYVNWNALTFNRRISEKEIRLRRGRATEDLLYYGSWRESSSRRRSRVEYFDRYFAAPRVPVTISSPLVKGRNKFQERYTNPLISHADKLVESAEAGGVHEQIGCHGSGLYIEDVASHSEYHSPPNRFYEMLSAGLPIIFQPECGATLRQGGYDPTPYQARTPLEVQRAHERREETGAAQRREWLDKARSDADGVTHELRWAAKKLEQAL